VTAPTQTHAACVWVKAPPVLSPNTHPKHTPMYQASPAAAEPACAEPRMCTDTQACSCTTAGGLLQRGVHVSHTSVASNDASHMHTHASYLVHRTAHPALSTASQASGYGLRQPRIEAEYPKPPSSHWLTSGDGSPTQTHALTLCLNRHSRHLVTVRHHAMPAY
jgi:hypothetical protein